MVKHVQSTKDQSGTSRVTAALLPRIVATDSTPVMPVQIRTDNTFTPPADIYQEYLLARNRYNQQTNNGREDALNIMTGLVRAYPDYADAQAFYALLSFESSARTNGEIPWVTAEAPTKLAQSLASACRSNKNSTRRFC